MTETIAEEIFKLSQTITSILNYYLVEKNAEKILKVSQTITWWKL